MEELSLYTGAAIADLLDSDRQEAFRLNWERTEANYGAGVDSMLLREQILFTEETIPLLYAPPTPAAYIPGTRPQLEQLARSLTAGIRSETECALAVMRYLRDSYQRCKGRHLFYGGTEEILLEKHEQLCEGVSRLFVALLETVGIPARMITHVIGGHVVAEAWADGKWGYIDVRKGLYFYGPDRRLLSFLELFQDPSLADRQDPLTREDCSPRFPYGDAVSKLKSVYLSPVEINTFKLYSISNAHRYRYSWSTFEECFHRGVNDIAVRHSALRCRLIGTPPAAEAQILTTLPEGAVLEEDILLAVRVNGTAVHPRQMRFYLDGNLLWEYDGWVPLSEFSTPAEGVVLFRNAGGLFPVSGLADGIHTLKITVSLSPVSVKEKELRFYKRSPQNPAHMASVSNFV